MKNKSHRSVRFIAGVLTAALFVICFTTACQPTPEKPVVVGKNDNVFSSANNDSQEAEPYAVPETLQYEMEGLPDCFRIVFDAQVNVPDQTSWPVYVVEPTIITQQQADAVRMALLGDTVLYKPEEYRTREEIQDSIDRYERELKYSIDEGYAELMVVYQEFLKELYVEYERTPKNLILEEADTSFASMKERPWAGSENIYGICWLENSRKMEFSASNGADSGSSLYYELEEGNLMNEYKVSYSLNEAVDRADKLLEMMGLDFTLADASTQMIYQTNSDGFFDFDVIIGEASHTLLYKPAVEDVPQDNIVSCIDQNIVEAESYRSAILRQETISISMDDFGVFSFFWRSPMQIVAQESASVQLMSFADVQQRIEQQLKVQTLWDNSDAEWIDARRLEIYRIKLSYMLIPKANDMDRYYLAPLWNVCGDLYHCYKDSYPTGTSNTYILDENFELNVWRHRFDPDYSILTINAIDGSVIPRYRWY